jgi:hypothetical protein
MSPIIENSTKDKLNEILKFCVGNMGKCQVTNMSTNAALTTPSRTEIYRQAAMVAHTCAALIVLESTANIAVSWNTCKNL